MTTAYQALTSHISTMRNSFLLSITALLVLVVSKLGKFKGDTRAIIGACVICVAFGTAIGFKSSWDFSVFLNQIERENKVSDFFSIQRARGWVYLGFVFNLIVVGILLAYLAFYFMGPVETPVRNE